MDTKSGSDPPSIPSKKSKKHKQKSRKANFLDDDAIGDLIIPEDGNGILSSKTNPLPSSKPPSATLNKKHKKRDSVTSSDEEKWLTAIESGKLEDVDDELKYIKPKDPALMTARQRAMYDDNPRTSTPALVSLPTGYKEKVVTAEAIEKAAIQAQRRKQLADEKREKDKKKIIDRLLKKQESKATKTAKPKPTRSTVLPIVYTQNMNSTTLTFPENVKFPLKSQKIICHPSLKYCSMGCGNLRKYSCSKTGAALCSLSCYKQNIVNRKL